MDRVASIDERRSLAAGRDPRQTHFSFWVEEDPATNAPGKKQPSPASDAINIPRGMKESA
jgi:hypothetical protein